MDETLAVSIEELQHQQATAPAVGAQDHTANSVPLSERRDSLTMGLLWVTMVTGFPSVLVGFEWFKQGLSLPQVIGCSLISCVVLMLYCLPSCLLGSKSGLTYALLSRKVFGRWGSWVVSLNLVWLCIAWYGLTAVFLANGLEGIYHWHFSPFWFSVALAFAMAFNNFFGFSGVANFARYLAGPVLVAWVGYTFFKACTACPTTVWVEPGHIADPLALMLVSSFVIGYSVWGNEADYWRFGKPGVLPIVTPIAAALAVGEFLFPITGWMLARITGVTGYEGATSLMNNYAFGGLSLAAAAVLVVTYFAVNDSSLYGAINALQNINPIPRRRMTALLACTGAITAGFLSGITKNFENVACLSCIFLPCATIVILAELWLVSREVHRHDELTRVPAFHELPSIRWTAVVAFALGCAVGLATSGIIPGTDSWHVGVPSLQAWATTLTFYVGARWWQRRSEQCAVES